MDSQCNARNASGAPCGAQADASGFCRWHDPARQAEMTEARRRGGQARSNQNRARKEIERTAMSPKQLEGIVGATITAVLDGTKPPGVGQAIAALVRAAVSVREATQVEERLGELADQVARLERRGA